MTALVGMREQEGGALASILTQRLARLTVLRQAAEDCPARKPEAVRARLAESVALLAGQSKFDETRLYQEALLLAAKADVREELTGSRPISQRPPSFCRQVARSAGGSIFSPRSSGARQIRSAPNRMMRA